jgi:hypothetical protein
MPGDFNYNGVVDAADYVVWRKGLGTTFTHSDYDVWRANFGQTSGNGAAGYSLGVSTQTLSAIVPEPATALLLYMAVFTMLLHTRQSNPRGSTCAFVTPLSDRMSQLYIHADQGVTQ